MSNTARWHESETVDRSREQMIAANSRLVVALARRYAGRGVALADLIQEGTIGLIVAVDRFDWRRGTQFGTFAALCIKQAICDALPGLRSAIRIPAPVLRDARRVSEAVEYLAQQIGREPTLAEVERHLGQAAGSGELPLEPISLDSAAWDDSDESLADQLPDADHESPEAASLRAAAAELVGHALDRLPALEAQVVRLRYGLGDTPAEGIDAVARRLRLSRPRVQTLEEAALRRLRRGLPATELRIA